MKAKLYRDTENGTIYSREELYKSYEELKANGETEAETFDKYLHNCLSKNGFLEAYNLVPLCTLTK